MKRKKQRSGQPIKGQYTWVYGKRHVRHKTDNINTLCPVCEREISRGICGRCADRRDKLFMRDCKLRGLQRTGWRKFLRGEKRPYCPPIVGIWSSKRERAVYKGYIAAEMFYRRAA